MNERRCRGRNSWARVRLALLLAACLGVQAARGDEGAPSPAAERYRALERAARVLEEGGRVEDLEAGFPGLADRLRRAHDPVLLSLWGRSSPIDSSSGREILAPAVRERLGIGTEKTARGTAHVHAGLMHTYGYMFSTIDTPYGRKSKRWVESRLDERLGLGAGRFTLLPAGGGEFLANVTWTLLHAIGRWEALAPEVRSRLAAGVTPALVHLRPKAASEVVTETTEHGEGALEVKTAFVPLAPTPGREGEDWLLVYWTEEPENPELPRLTTAFPVDARFRGKVLASIREGAPFRPRYNLVLP